jgi:uncharacterized protein YgbK (DUF1537 family)
MLQNLLNKKMLEKKKIFVIADDFTGAAEIGGIGIRNGLKVTIETKPIFSKENDIIVVATDTRSMDKYEAAVHISKLTHELLGFNPLFIYKKIDSVFRGNISEELVAQLKVCGKKRAIIIAANPVFKRIIANGRYFIDDIPLNQTCFSIDSQYPIRTNEVLKLLNPVEDLQIVSLKSDDPLPEQGLIIGDVENLHDLQKWASKYDENTIFAGAFGFFDSILKSLNYIQEVPKFTPLPFRTPALFILGSYYPKDDSILAGMIEQGHYHSNMPEEIYYNKESDPSIMQNWVEEVTTNLIEKQKVIVTCDYLDSKESNISFRIKKSLAELVKRVFDKVPLHEILIEGGSTTSEILEHLEITKLTPIQELDTGVIRMKVDGNPELCLTTKPGSYMWPTSVWSNSNANRDDQQNINDVKLHE